MQDVRAAVAEISRPLGATRVICTSLPGQDVAKDACPEPAATRWDDVTVSPGSTIDALDAGRVSARSTASASSA